MQRWSDAQLVAAAGRVPVKVERRTSENVGFGTEDACPLRRSVQLSWLMGKLAALSIFSHGGS